MAASPPAAYPALEDRVVRFDDACVLIPPPEHRSRLPRLLSKSYSLPPLFRRRESSLESESAEPDRSPPLITNSSSFMSTLPRLSKKSPSPHFSECEHKPLSPCLVHRDPSMHDRARAPRRRPSLPLPTEVHSPHSPHAHVRVGSDLVTVPLRPCCTNCFTVTDACIMQGELWSEKFSRGARRLRSASADHPVRPRLTSHASLQERLPSFSAIAVDEIDKGKGKSHPAVDENKKEDAREHAGEAAVDLDGPWSVHGPDDRLLSPLISRRGPKLSPIPSNNPSTDDLVYQASLSSPELSSASPPPLYPTSPTQAHAPRIIRRSVDSPASPFPRTPSPVHTSPSSPKSRIHMPSGAEMMRLGAGVIKGMAQFSGV